MKNLEAKDCICVLYLETYYSWLSADFEQHLSENSLQAQDQRSWTCSFNILVAEFVLWARHCAKLVMHLISWSSFYMWDNWDSGGLRNQPKVFKSKWQANLHSWVNLHNFHTPSLIWNISVPLSFKAISLLTSVMTWNSLIDVFSFSSLPPSHAHFVRSLLSLGFFMKPGLHHTGQL